jgi:hypothetical protein
MKRPTNEKGNIDAEESKPRKSRCNVYRLIVISNTRIDYEPVLFHYSISVCGYRGNNGVVVAAKKRQILLELRVFPTTNTPTSKYSRQHHLFKNITPNDL